MKLRQYDGRPRNFWTSLQMYRGDGNFRMGSSFAGCGWAFGANARNCKALSLARRTNIFFVLQKQLIFTQELQSTPQVLQVLVVLLAYRKSVFHARCHSSTIDWNQETVVEISLQFGSCIDEHEGHTQCGNGLRNCICALCMYCDLQNRFRTVQRQNLQAVK